MKILEENIGSKISDISHSKFLPIYLLGQGKQSKICKWGYIKLKSFGPARIAHLVGLFPYYAKVVSSIPSQGTYQNQTMTTYKWNNKLMFLSLSLKSINLKKLKSLCTTKETINKMNARTTEWENIFTSDTPDKGLIFQNIKRTYTTQQQRDKQIKNGQGT